MSDNKNIFETLGNYMRDVFDTNSDGVVSIKELMGIFPNMAIPIAIVFVDVLVLAAEYRVWDFGYYVTGNEILAAGFVLVSAIPFLLGQIFWLYPRAVFFQKAIAISFVAISLYTSAQFGLADLTREYDKNSIFTFLVQLTAFYIVATLIYVVIDPTIKANRMKKKAEDMSKFEREKQVTARSILSDLRATLDLKKQLEADFGADEVSQALLQLSGKKRPQGQAQPARPMQTYAATAPEPPSENPTTGQERKP